MKNRHFSEQKAALRMILYCVLLFAAAETSQLVLGKPSRRLCNMPWVLSQLWFMQTVFTVNFISERFLLNLRNTNGVLNAIN